MVTAEIVFHRAKNLCAQLLTREGFAVTMEPTESALSPKQNLVPALTPVLSRWCS